MTTKEYIFTEDDVEIFVDDIEFGVKGRNLIFTIETGEVRLRLTDDQFKALGEELGINGYITIIEDAGL